ncbi:hypothetical protein C6H88_02145 [Chlamydia muridarum str. Nigg]|uniref:Uncharacterized protein n=2 Tax=Chlamydia muridarum TaxID=83560 RepID=A0A069ZRE8_CHLMR|nr:hypothetical protein [Chlamydia muridarum]UFT29169.1 hypothetical protein FTN71_02230 [Chlamydia trachomatis]AAF39275.1 conserved hypothetical protein [Chlamydia muridarum str. Nigg]AHH22803.1 hypothetical protein TAC_02175 [Chlamydia muridarum str. Nigg3 CMUT3-5]AHH23728.1 hypothetical protein Y015_02175 [Chlamydia muridarum str. Nigg CM972]AID37942.1 hypothetical protein BB17_02215 [Chlamydia muridarum str. Nigg 2 MCR]
MSASDKIINDCRFDFDTTVHGDLLASNLTTEGDITAKTVSATETFSVGRDVDVKTKDIVVDGLTGAGGYDLTTQGKISINLKGNRLSNVKRPVNDTEPVPANYIRTPEYFFCSLKYGARIEWSQGSILPLVGPSRLVYQSSRIGKFIRFADFSVNNNSIKVDPTGTKGLQLLSRGLYIINVGIGKRWGWNNGYGGDYCLGIPGGVGYSESSTFSRGGYYASTAVGTAIHIRNKLANPDEIPIADQEAMKTLLEIRYTSKDDYSILSTFYLGVLVYPEVGE